MIVFPVVVAASLAGASPLAIDAATGSADGPGTSQQAPTTGQPAPADPAATTPAPATPAPAQPAASSDPLPAPTPAPTAARHAARNPNEIVVTATTNAPKQDPLMAINKQTYVVMQKVDDLVVAPIALGYKKALPVPVRKGLHNFFFNLTEPVAFVNFLLQLKPGKAAETAARFGINSTIGVAGLLDVAKKKPFHLPYRRNGLANTLGYYGIGPGPYLFLPFVGPTTLRDLLGTLVDQVVVPLSVGAPFNRPYYVLPANTVQTLDYRVEIDDDLKQIRATSSPYSTYRQVYLKTRFDEIEALHGRGPLAKGEVGIAPFARPLVPAAPEPAPAAGPPVVTPPPPAAPPPAEVAPPPAPLPPVFIAEPVVQPLPDDYRPADLRQTRHRASGHH